MTLQDSPHSFSIEDIITSYPKFYSEKRLDLWRCLFSDQATVVRTESGRPAVSFGIEQMMQAQSRFVSDSERIEEKWDRVEVHRFGTIALVKANYRLVTDHEVREGIDVLTLIRQLHGWKICCLAYEQTGFSRDLQLPPNKSEQNRQESSAENAKMESAFNLADELSKQAELRPDATAIYLPKGTQSYRNLEVVTWQVATFLHQNGVKPGDVVALTFVNVLTCLVTLLALARIGATAFSIPRRSPSLLRAEMAARAKARILATDLTGGDTAGLPRLLINLNAISTAATPIDFTVRDKSPRAPWLLITGSGSTGRPKNFSVSHSQFLAQMSIHNEALALTGNDRVGSLISIETVITKKRFLEALCAGAALVFFDRKRRDSIRECGVTILWGAVIQAEELLNKMTAGTVGGLGSLRVLALGSSTVSDSLRQRVSKVLTPNLYVYYGINELGLAAIASPADIAGTPGTVGRPPAGITVEVVDAEGKALPAGDIGLIRIKSPGAVDGYLDDAAATERAFREGWFYPGDLGRFAPGGQLIYCGRSDHMMIMNGINIYPAEIEAVVTNHPAVRDAAAVPLGHAVCQDIPVCAVVLYQRMKASEKELLNFAFQRLGWRGPKRIMLLERIPRNEQGKLLRPELVKEILNRLDLESNNAAA